MVKLTYAPVQELIIHDVLEISLDDLMRGRVTPAGVLPLYWCDGILFTFTSLPLGDEVTSDYLKGKIHWLEVQFARHPQYKPVLSLNDDEYKGTVNVRVIDTSVSPLHKEFMKWLKANTQNTAKK